MKKVFLLFAFFTYCTFTYSQGKVEQTTSIIFEEGKKLYKSEMASWYGTDIFLEKFGSKRDSTGGYFSYVDNSIARCLFFSKEESPKVILTVAFDSTYNIQTASIDASKRDFSVKEKELYAIRKAAVNALDTDTLFRRFKETNFNVVPLIENDEKKVYVLTGPQHNGVVIIGNDYLLSFDKENKLVDKKRLHKSLLTIPFASDDEAITMHTHLKEMGDYITPTDVCTLLLYGKFAKWKQHIAISEKYVNIWDCKTEKLIVLTTKAWEKLNKDQEKRSKK